MARFCNCVRGTVTITVAAWITYATPNCKRIATAAFALLRRQMTNLKAAIKPASALWMKCGRSSAALTYEQEQAEVGAKRSCEGAEKQQKPALAVATPPQESSGR